MCLAHLQQFQDEWCAWYICYMLAIMWPRPMVHSRVLYKAQDADAWWGFNGWSVMCEAHESFPCARLKMRIRTVRMEGRGWRKGAYYPYDLPRHCSVSIHYFTQVKSNRDSYLSTIFFFWYIMGIQTTIFVHIMYGQVNMVLTHGTSDSSRRNRWHRRYHATQT